MDMELKILEPDKLILRRGPILVVPSKEGAEYQTYDYLAQPLCMVSSKSTYLKNIPLNPIGSPSS